MGRKVNLTLYFVCNISTYRAKSNRRNIQIRKNAISITWKNEYVDQLTCHVTDKRD